MYDSSYILIIYLFIFTYLPIIRQWLEQPSLMNVAGSGYSIICLHHLRMTPLTAIDLSEPGFTIDWARCYTLPNTPAH